MLEFEEFEEVNQAPKMTAEVTAPAGFVVIPVEQYKELLLAAESTYIPIKVCKESWNGGATIVAEVDKDWLLSVASELLKQRYSLEDLAKYALLSPDDIYTPSVTIAKRRPPEPEEL